MKSNKLTQSHKILSFSIKEIILDEYSEIPLLRSPKIKTFGQLKTLFAKFKLFVSSFSTPSVSLIRDHLWDCPKVVFKTTFGQSQRPPLDSLKGGLNIGILLYYAKKNTCTIRHSPNIVLG